MERYGQNGAGAQDLEKCLAIGECVFLDLDPENESKERYRAVIRGWEKDRFIMLERPSPGMKTLHRGRLCALRLVRDGEVLGFYSTILDLVPARSDKKIHIAWPKKVSHLMIRRNERATVDIPCTATLADDSVIQGRIRDLSASGCRVLFKMTIAEGAVFNLAFTLPDGVPVQELSATICHRFRPKQDINPDNFIAYGCEFNQPDQSEKYGIGLYVARIIAERRGEEAAHPCVLILTSNGEDIPFIREALSQHVAYDFIRVGATLDVIYQLHRYAVKAVLIRNEDRALCPLSLCALFKETPRFEALTMAVYGDGWSEAADRQLAQIGSVWIEDMSKIPLLGHRLAKEEREASGV
jgi:hypothetical protein